MSEASKPLVAIIMGSRSDWPEVMSHAAKTLDELEGHRIVSYSGQPAQHLSAITWIETAGRDGKGPREPVFRHNPESDFWTGTCRRRWYTKKR